MGGGGTLVIEEKRTGRGATVALPLLRTQLLPLVWVAGLA